MNIMKQKVILLGMSSLTLTFLCTALPARADEAGPYIHADLGPALTEDTRLKEFPGGFPGGKVKFDAGARFSIGGGWQFYDWLFAGGESGVIGNDLRGADATLSQVPLMANVEFRCPSRCPVVPFIGGGPGLAISVIDFDHDSLAGGERVNGSSADTVFAWQIYGGARYKLNDHMSIGVVYKYFEAGSPTWDVRHTSEDIRFGNAHTHSFGASFSMEF